MDSSLIEEDDIQSESMSLVDIKLGSLELNERTTRLELKNGKLSELPPSPNCPLLRVLSLQGNADLMEIPSSFFDHLPLLRTLDLSYTSITDLPGSLFGLMELRVLRLRGCELFMELPPEIGQLKKLKELDLNETQITHVPTEIQELINLLKLSLSFYEYDQNISQVIPKGLISKLTRLSYLSIDVNPEHSKWDETVGVILQEIAELSYLRTLILYVPTVELLKYIPERRDLDFQLVVGRHMQRIISRVPPMVEENFKQGNRSLRFVYGHDGNGVDVPQEINRVLRRTNTFFLDRHMTIKHLSEFGLMNLDQLQVCMVAECNEMQTILKEGHSQFNPLPCLEVLSVFYMKNLRGIWEGGATRCLLLGQLKFLTLHTCLNLTSVFTLDFIHNLVNLEELIVQDCPKVTTLVTAFISRNLVALSATYFLPRIKKISLLYLPELVSISSGLQIGPNLEKIGLYYCSKLQNISTKELCSKKLKVIKGETKWWKTLRWREAMKEQSLNHLFSAIDEEMDIMTQLLADVNESSNNHEIGDWGQTNLTNELVQGKDLTRQLELCLSEPSPSRGTSEEVGSTAEASQPTGVALPSMAEGVSINEDSDRYFWDQGHEASGKRYAPYPEEVNLDSLSIQARLMVNNPKIKSSLKQAKLRLMFTKELSIPIFTGSKVLDTDGNPIRVFLIDEIDQMVYHDFPVKLEIVVLDGDFPFKDNEDWTSEQFNNYIVKERTGRRPLLAGELDVTTREGIAQIGDIEFSDNSSLTRSMRVRIAVRVAAGSTQGVRIREAVTKAFMVQDHPMDWQRKHYPPTLDDQVWRLENILRGGNLHLILYMQGIKTVQDFLKSYVVYPDRLKEILRISKSKWDATIKHAENCIIGNKLYVFRESNFAIVLNPICQWIKAVINGQIISPKDVRDKDRLYIERLVREAHSRWSTLEEIDAPLNEVMTLLTPGETVKQSPKATMDQLDSCDDTKEQYGDAFVEAAGHGGSNVTSQVGSNEGIKHPKYQARQKAYNSKIKPALKQPLFRLMFTKKLSLPIFTGSKVLDIDGNPIRVVLEIDSSIISPIKFEIVVLDGDFPFKDNEDWTSEQFNSYIVKERAGKRPLLTGELEVIMWDGIAQIEDIEFTDNSSWIRSKKYRIAVRVVAGSKVGRIREAVTEAFVVKDHRAKLLALEEGGSSIAPDASSKGFMPSFNWNNSAFNGQKSASDNDKTMFFAQERRRRLREQMKKQEDCLPRLDKLTSTADTLDLAVDYIEELKNQIKMLTNTKAKCTCSKGY